MASGIPLTPITEEEKRLKLKVQSYKPNGGGGLEWSGETNKLKTALDDLLQQQDNSLRIIFVKIPEKIEDNEREDWRAKIRDDIKDETVGIPPELWDTVTEDLNGCSGARYTYEGDSVASLDTWSCFKIKVAIENPTNKKVVYKWHQSTVFVRWNKEHGSPWILCLGFPDVVEAKWKDSIPPINPKDPYGWHIALLNDLKKEYDNSVWKMRDLERDKNDGSKTDFRKLHDIARHLSHSNETLDVTMETIDSLIHEHESFNDVKPKSGTAQPATPSSQSTAQSATSNLSIPDKAVSDIDRRLYYVLKEIRAIKARSASLNFRLQNEINLNFNLASQTDTAAMKIISAIGLIFLPGTFISTIFGMNFFDFAVEDGKQSFTVSKRFWLFWAVAIPITVVVIGLWAVWNYWFWIKKRTKPFWKKFDRRQSQNGRPRTQSNAPIGTSPV
ncbi:hypothetical protein FQN52_002120 [Onygenales sp. PD_12]|nr:hypothetical protein FQN52_002120 [Onygenales sp. PD_12]KAK2803728.1 hypothetical protein FQN51_002957 [Onygenales sp. PD_10]